MSKKIIFNKSSLLSLKAELLKKQEEINEKKRLPESKIENFKVPHSKTSGHQKTDHQKRQTFGEHLKNIDNEELEAYKKTKLALQKKTELYEHLSNPMGDSQLAERFLVDFSSKKQDLKQSSRNEKQDIEQENNESPQKFIEDSEWCEFTDSLGRTRICHYTDLELYKTRDEDLMQTFAINKTISEQTQENDEHKNLCEKPELVQKTQDYLNMLREKWEKQEQELLSKDKDVHYQDLLFDEARMHGVGYYSFSTDETERRKQMEELIKRREETLKVQKETEEVRKKREQLIQARVAAARARQRARAGLPPEEPQDNSKDFTARLLEFLTQQKNAADSEAAEKDRKIREEQERERQKLRDAYVREWDIGKIGVEEKQKVFREMTQEEYVEQQRAKRIDEFAPPTNSHMKKCEAAFDDKGNSMSSTNDLPKKSWSDVRKHDGRVSPSFSNYDNCEEDTSWNGGLYFSTNRKSDFSKIITSQEKKLRETITTPIVNELDEDIDDYNHLNESKQRVRNSKAEVPPPPTYEYYTPAFKRSKTQKPFDSDLTQAYEQGLKSLEMKNNKKSFSQRYDFTF